MLLRYGSQSISYLSDVLRSRLNTRTDEEYDDIRATVYRQLVCLQESTAWLDSMRRAVAFRLPCSEIERTISTPEMHVHARPDRASHNEWCNEFSRAWYSTLLYFPDRPLSIPRVFMTKP